MWTSEYIDDKIVVTILDDTGSEADLKIEMIEDKVIFRQYSEIDEELNDLLGDGEGIYDEICITADQFNELIEAMKRPEGVFVRKMNSN
jgi:hypothetical protein